MKKIAIATLALIMLAACSSTKTGTASKEINNSGSTSTITVEVTVEGDKITSLTIDETYNETTKKTLGADYGMASTSQAIGKITENSGEWFEQVAYLENYIVENGLESVTSQLGNDGYATGDLTAGCTISISNFVDTIEEAIASAK